MSFERYDFINDSNDEHKMRINLSLKAISVIEDDMETFNVSGVGSFINLVFSNYRDSAKASITNYIKNREIELLQTLVFSDNDPDIRSKIIKTILDSEEREIKASIEQNKNERGVSKLYYINKNNREYINDSFTDNEFYSRPSLYIKCVIEEYCALPFIQRERIIKSEFYQLIENACRLRQALKIYTEADGKVFSLLVKPYKILTDPMGTQDYLVCKSRLYNQPEETMGIASFSMCRLNRLAVLKSMHFSFSGTEKKEIKKTLANFSPAYLTNGFEEIHVKLTEKGKQLYHKNLFARPIKDARSTNDEFIFLCSPHQAYRYFFSFGKDAEILSPAKLREMFISDYQKALLHYTQKK